MHYIRGYLQGILDQMVPSSERLLKVLGKTVARGFKGASNSALEQKDNITRRMVLDVAMSIHKPAINVAKEQKKANGSCNPWPLWIQRVRHGC